MFPSLDIKRALGNYSCKCDPRAYYEQVRSAFVAFDHFSDVATILFLRSDPQEDFDDADIMPIETALLRSPGEESQSMRCQVHLPAALATCAYRNWSFPENATEFTLFYSSTTCCKPVAL